MTAPPSQVLAFYSRVPIWVEEEWEDGQRDSKHAPARLVSTGNNKIIKALNDWKCTNLTHHRFAIMLVLKFLKICLFSRNSR